MSVPVCLSHHCMRVYLNWLTRRQHRPAASVYVVAWCMEVDRLDYSFILIWCRAWGCLWKWIATVHWTGWSCSGSTAGCSRCKIRCRLRYDTDSRMNQLETSMRWFSTGVVRRLWKTQLFTYLVKDTVYHARRGLFALCKMIDLTHFGSGYPRKLGIWPWHSNTVEIFVQCTYTRQVVSSYV